MQILFSIVLVFVGITIVVSLLNGETFIAMLPLVLILLVTAVPVAMPAMFTVSMAKGSQQLAAKGILVSRLSATEDAATLTNLCIDKTGTITQNKLSVQDIKAEENFTVDDILRYGALASVAANNDPVDMAFLLRAADNKTDISGYRQTSFKCDSASRRIGKYNQPDHSWAHNTPSYHQLGCKQNFKNTGYRSLINEAMSKR